MSDIITVYSVSEFLEYIKELLLTSERSWWFRGHANTDWKVHPAVWRDFTKEEEAQMTREYLFGARTRTGTYPGNTDLFGWLAFMQQHGLPTRLLEWTKSPLTALYFAAWNYHRHSFNPSTHDGCIWMLCPGRLNRYFGHQDLVYPADGKRARRMLKQVFYSDPQDNLGALAVPAIESQPKMMLQQIAFTIHSEPEALETLAQSEGWLQKIEIPADALADIALELEMLNVQLSGLFPDPASLAREISAKHRMG